MGLTQFRSTNVNTRVLGEMSENRIRLDRGFKINIQCSVPIGNDYFSL